MLRRSTTWGLAAVAACGAVGWSFGGCTTSGTVVQPLDGGPSEDSAVPDAAGPDTGPTSVDSGPNDAAPADAGTDAPPVVTGMAIVTSNGAPLLAAPGTALPLEVVFTLSNGTTEALPASAQYTWTSPATITTQDPYDAGPNSVLPDGGAQPTAFYVSNPYRTDRTDYPGLLFVLSQGSVADAGVTITARFGDGGTISAVVPVGPAPVGDPDAGRNLFQSVLVCAGCHGTTGDGSQPVLMDDGGILLVDGGPVYSLQGGQYPYPAPGLNDTYLPDDAGPNLAADPAWSGPLLGMAAQGDLDNLGVALRAPMPDWSKGKNALGQPLSAQDFANIYAWLKTQTQ